MRQHELGYYVFVQVRQSLQLNQWFHMGNLVLNQSTTGIEIHLIHFSTLFKLAIMIMQILTTTTTPITYHNCISIDFFGHFFNIDFGCNGIDVHIMKVNI